MNNEEKKAIEILKTFTRRRISKNYNKIDYGDVEATEIALNLIEKQQKEIEDKKEEIYSIAKTNYILGQTDERSQWYKKINEISKEYQEKMKNDKDCKNIFNANNIRQEVITVLNNRLIGKEE